MNVTEKIQGLKNYEIVRTMITGLRNPRTRVNFSTFGEVFEEVCVGCAALQTICTLGDTTPVPEMFKDGGGAQAYLGDEWTREASYFEMAIDDLRWGKLGAYNEVAAVGGFAQIPAELMDYKLPKLDDDNYLDDLPAYEKFADELEALELRDTAEWVQENIIEPAMDSVEKQKADRAFVMGI